MNIEMAGKDRIIVFLSEAELEGFHMDLSIPGRFDTHGRYLINKILSLAQRRTGLSFEGKRIKVEALRYRFGCMMVITVSEKRKLYRIIYRSRRNTGFIIPDSRGALCCLGLLFLAGGEGHRCSLYRGTDAFILELPDSADGIIPLVRLFSSGISRDCAQLTAGAKAIFSDNAIGAAGRLIFGR